MEGDRKESESILISSSDYKDMMPSADFSSDSKDQEAEDRLRIARDLKAGLHPLKVFFFFFFLNLTFFLYLSSHRFPIISPL